ncbi:trypsin-like serine peptidase [Methylobacterium sp. J-077]|uniref:trypsin-like serine peptidase n=1 Tax=Methylobacterium sp. J-077 TaxID=2836656 RepID=UPI001FB879C6|nr:trypsin-like serine protease [Methylobacterium sp. J-077]MCJ2121800.1 S1 family peptidase [Methylobacterium sp. J-077]
MEEEMVRFNAGISIAIIGTCFLSLISQAKSQNRDGNAINYEQSMPFTLPLAQHFTDEDAAKVMTEAFSPSPQTDILMIPGSVRGSTGSGEKNQITVGATKLIPTTTSPVISLDFGTSGLPFTTARADLDAVPTNETYPYRAAGKLFFLISGKTYICSASLIHRGIVVTAAHCVAEFGKNSYYSGWQFIPGFRNTDAPFGRWNVVKAVVPTSYINGTDSCTERGVICQNDVAILVMEPQKDAAGQTAFPGDRTGWFAYGWDRAGFTPQGITHITQLGYPGCLDDSNFMERNDAQATSSRTHSSNTILGSMMCGGSSGGPLLINFGKSPKFTGTSEGSAPVPNQVVGVTSWGSSDNRVKWMGASPFISLNIKSLVDSACKAYPDNCKE